MGEAVIRRITKREQGGFKGHYLVGLETFEKRSLEKDLLRVSQFCSP
jgi:hypothetical protein